MKVIDLFCGAGGFSLGFKQAGFDIILGVDIWDIALKTHKLNVGGDVLNVDVRDLETKDLPACDVLIGSPPCPDFSIQTHTGGKSKKKKADLSCIEAFHRILTDLTPKYWIWENVPGVKKYLYFQPYMILDAQEYGVPQRRKRIFVGNFPLPVKRVVKGRIAPTILAWELCGGWDGYNTRRFSQWLGRKPSSEEMALYMGFPPYFKFLGNQKERSLQIGNAVCPPVAKAIAEAILKKEK